MSTAGLAEVSA